MEIVSTISSYIKEYVDLEIGEVFIRHRDIEDVSHNRDGKFYVKINKRYAVNLANPDPQMKWEVPPSQKERKVHIAVE